MVGESSRAIEYAKPPEVALLDIERAFRSIGRVREVSRPTHSITGKTRYGLRYVKLRVSVAANANGGSTIHIQGAGDDVWGGAARKGTDKLIRALSSQHR